MKPDREVILHRDIRYQLFRIYLFISAFLGLIFTIIHLINRRPPVNYLTSIGVFGICFLWYLLSSDEKRYAFSRISFLAVFSLVWLPFGYLTSPGSYSAMPYMVIMVAFIVTVLVRSPWEYIFPVSMIAQMPFLFRSEIWIPDIYIKYTDEVYRINDLTLNFTAVITAIACSAAYIMYRYQRINMQLYDLSVLDDLTGLYNKRYLVKFLEMEHNRTKRHGRGFTLIFIDLDNFKKINDTMGHLEGDRVLVRVAEIILANIRNYDIAARYGGDEFVVIFPETNLKETEQRMDGLNQQFLSFSEKYSEQGLSVSWGISESGYKSVDQIISDADSNLYRKKRGEQ